jgi:hypothetical protein
MVAQVGYSGAGRSRGRMVPCAVCTWHVETRSAGFLIEPQNQGGGGFPGLGLKTGSFGLVIWASKSPRRFLGLGLKTKWASVCQLRHKTDEGRSARDTRRDLAACLAAMYRLCSPRAECVIIQYGSAPPAGGFTAR